MDKYCYVYFVIHERAVEHDADNRPIHDTKAIGIYSKKALADAAIQRFVGLIGFRSYPNDFYVLKRRCYYDDQPSWKLCANITIYQPYHEYYIPDEDCDLISRGAFFANQSKAETVLQEWKTDEKLAEYPDGFEIIKYTVDKDIRLWSEGFDQ